MIEFLSLDVIQALLDGCLFIIIGNCLFALRTDPNNFKNNLICLIVSIYVLVLTKGLSLNMRVFLGYFMFFFLLFIILFSGKKKTDISEEVELKEKFEIDKKELIAIAEKFESISKRTFNKSLFNIISAMNGNKNIPNQIKLQNDLVDNIEEFIQLSLSKSQERIMRAEDLGELFDEINIIYRIFNNYSNLITSFCNLIKSIPPEFTKLEKEQYLSEFREEYNHIARNFEDFEERIRREYNVANIPVNIRKAPYI
jgi:hypothetical protein